MKGDKKNIMERRKPKSPQKENLESVDGRDTFQTPNYATDIIVPYLRAKKYFSKDRFRIWECAAGLGKMVSRLEEKGLEVFGTDLEDFPSVNFLTDCPPMEFDCIVTNTPFSLKRKFYEKCVSYRVPFALLLPADYSGWIIKATQDGAEKIIPARRIDYITPNTLNRIHEGEVWELVRGDYPYEKLEEMKLEKEITWEGILEKYWDYRSYDSIYDAPQELLRKYSSSYFHSMWLTWGFGIGKSETFVELSNEMKNNI